ncbi:MAG: hypothetical protein J0L87_06040 [Bacteroidetes bacterium]|nr:hypothetical protein [Bacteroidota bacterium]
MKNFKFIFFLIVFWTIGLKINGATITWNSGITGNWNVASNWTPAQVPGVNDIAVFNATKLGSCVMNVNVDIGGISVQSGYTGTISQSSGIKVKIGSQNAIFSAATFTGSATTTDSIIVNGTFTLSGSNFTSTSGYLVLKNTVTYSSGTFSNNNGTVNFAATVAQTIPAWNYANLTSSSTGTRTLASSGTIGISNTFTKGTNTFTVTGSTVNYNGTGAQTITAFNYNNLTISGARTTNSITLANAGTIGISSNFTNSATFTTGTYINTGSTLNYNGTGAQTVIAFNYNILTISGARTTNNVTLVNGGTIRVASTFTNSSTFTTGKIVSTNNTFEYNGASSQTIGAIDYNNLVSSSTGARVFASTGVIGIAGTFTKGSNTYTITGSTINYNGLGAQSIVAMNYNNLIISGARGANNITFPNGGVVGIAKNFSPFATFTSGTYIVSNSTIDYNGTGTQMISPFQYNNLTCSSTGQRSFATTGSIKINGTFTKGSNTYVNLGLGGEGFSSIDVGVNTKYWCAPIPNSSTVFIIGPAGFLLRSSNGGTTWEQIPVAGTTKDLRRIVFFDANNGLIGASAGLILKTTNGGSTWTAVQLSETENFSGVCYVNSSLVIATGGNSNCIIWRSTDGGSTWTKITNLTPATPRALYTTKFIDNLTGFAVGLNETLLKTVDGGLSWTLISSGTGWYHFSDIDITPNNTLFIVGNHLTNNDNRTYKSTDLGATLNIVNSSYVNWLGSVDFLDNNLGFASGGNVAGNTGVVYKTNDAGLTWTLYELGVSRIGSIRFADANSGYMYDLSGKIIKYSCCTEGGTVEFNGTVNQYINGGSTTVKCNTLKINKAGGKVYLNAPLQIQKNLTLTSGLLVSSASNTLEFSDNVDSVIATDNNYVAGPVRKIGNDAFSFPLGDTALASGALHPLRISAPSTTGDIFTASYSSSNQVLDQPIDTDSLESISYCETYTLVRNAGSSVVVPSISWNTNSCNADVNSDLRVAVWNSSKWESLGKSTIVIQGNRGTLSAATGLNLSTLSLTFGTALNKVLPPPVCSNDVNRNWISSRGFDGSGNIISESRAYSDYLGRTTQTQVKNLTENTVLAAQTIYDAYGRGVLQTLSAPINQSEFCYKDGFVTNTFGANYSFADFDIPNYTTNSSTLTQGEVDNPKPVGDSNLGTLGWYYSDNNTDEAYVPSSDFPYTRIQFDDNNGGALKRAAAAGEQLNMGSGHESYSFTMPAAGELRYFYGYTNGWVVNDMFEIYDYNNIGQGSFGDGQLTVNYLPEVKAFKTISLDQNGTEAISFVDIEGKLLANCLSGMENESNQHIQHVMSVIRPGIESEKFVDIHLPDGCQSSLTLANPMSSPQTSAITYNILNLKTGELVKFSGSPNFTGTTPNLPAGYYRIIYKSGAVISELPVKYDLNYYNFTLNYYDKAGRLKLSYPPNGVGYDYNPLITHDNLSTPQSVKFVSSPTPPNPNWSLIPSGFSNTISNNITLPTGGEVQITNTTVSLSRISPVVIYNNVGGRSMNVDFMGASIGNQSIGVGDNIDDFGPGDPSDPTDGTTSILNTYIFTFDIKNEDGVVIAPDRQLKAYNTKNFSGVYEPGNSGTWTVSSPETAIFDPTLSTTTSQVIVELKSLVKTVYTTGPTGVSFNPNAPLNSDIDYLKLTLFTATDRLPATTPLHKQPSVYDYNSLGWLLSDQTPDEGKSENVYKEDGLLKYSQNALQKASNASKTLRRFSYVNYDNINRPIETGEYDPTIPNGMISPIYFENYYEHEISPLQLLSVHNNLNATLDAGRCTQRNFVAYDYPDANFNTLTDNLYTTYLHNYTLYKVTKSWNANKTTWYGYDDQGRVIWNVQRIENMPSTGNHKLYSVNYKYDFNGNVLEVDYNKEVPSERFIHYYSYDNDKRMTKVETSRDGGVTKQEQALYSYYKHGPLKRTELGEKIQGVDYVYTINGWLKSMNDPTLTERDPGKDGTAFSIDRISKDLFGFTLDYFAGDYNRSSTLVQTFDDPANSSITKNLYNGLIKDFRWKTKSPDGVPGVVHNSNQLMYAYKYDKKYQLTDATFGDVTSIGTLNPTSGGPPPVGYVGPISNNSSHFLVNNITYDLQGNLLSLDRNDQSSAMDQLSYNYLPNSNKLDNVIDLAPVNSNGSLDFKRAQASGNYSYNVIGQLTADVIESNYYEYDVYGKTTVVYQNAARTLPKARFYYDENGHRIRKTTYDLSGNATKETWYVNDIAGNQLSIYENPLPGSLSQNELGIFGAGRIGVMETNGGTPKYVFELSDHLGNVRSTFSKGFVSTFSTSYSMLGNYDYLLSADDDENIDAAFNRPGGSGGSTKVYDLHPIGVKTTFDVVTGSNITANAYSYFNLTGLPASASLVIDIKNSSGAVVATYSQPITLTPNAWQPIAVVYTVTAVGTGLKAVVYPKWIGANPQSVWFDDLSINVLNGGGAYGAISLSLTDYYPHGGIMPGRNVVGADNYRYGYQGQFAEKDDETNFNNFELRAWDGRLGRWMNPDPYRQYHSPYLGMGNNPINKIDPNGGRGTDWYKGLDGNYQYFKGDGVHDGYTRIGDDNYFGYMLIPTEVSPSGFFWNNFAWSKNYGVQLFGLQLESGKFRKGGINEGYHDGANTGQISTGEWLAVAGVMKYTGKTVKWIGIVALPFTGGGSITLVEGGELLEDGADIIEAGVAIKTGNINKAASNGLHMIMNKAGGKLINHDVNDKYMKEYGKGFVGEGSGLISDQMFSY